jgi:hypothetical protein
MRSRRIIEAPIGVAFEFLRPTILLKRNMKPICPSRSSLLESAFELEDGNSTAVASERLVHKVVIELQARTALHLVNDPEVRFECGLLVVSVPEEVSAYALNLLHGRCRCPA